MSRSREVKLISLISLTIYCLLFSNNKQTQIVAYYHSIPSLRRTFHGSNFRWELCCQKGPALSQLSCVLSSVTCIIGDLSQFIGLHSALSSSIAIHSARNFAVNCAGAEEQNVPGKVEDSKPDMTWDIKSAPKLDFDEDYFINICSMITAKKRHGKNNL